MVAFDPQGSTAALNAAGYADTPAGRDSYSQDNPGATSYPSSANLQFDANGRAISTNSSSTNSSNNNSGQTGANIAAGQLLLQQAQQAAYQAYLNAKLALDTDQEAYQKAAQAAATEIAQAGVTGTFQGQPTQQAIKQAADIAQQQASTMVSYATQFGVWGTPQQGQQTLASQQQAFNQANQAAQLTGWYTPYTYTPPQAGAVPAGTGYPSAPAQGQGATGAAAPTPSGPLTQYPQGTVVRTNGNQFGVVGPGGTLTVGAPGDGTAAGDAIYRQIQANQGIMTIPDATFSNAQQAYQTYQTAQQAYQTAQTQQPQTAAAAQTIPQASQTLGVPPGYQAGQPVQTLAGQQQQYQQWLDAQKQADVEWQQQQTASQNYLSMLAGLRGPADWAKYQQVLGATPGGTKDLVAAAAGQYIPGGGATTGVQPQAANLNTLYNQATGANTGGQQDLSAMQNTLVAPNQMAPQTWNALTPSQQQMLLGVWESQGYSKDDAQALFNQSLPKYATSTPTTGNFRLQ